MAAYLSHWNLLYCVAMCVCVLSRFWFFLIYFLSLMLFGNHLRRHMLLYLTKETDDTAIIHQRLIVRLSTYNIRMFERRPNISAADPIRQPQQDILLPPLDCDHCHGDSIKHHPFGSPTWTTKEICLQQVSSYRNEVLLLLLMPPGLKCVGWLFAFSSPYMAVTFFVTSY